MEKLGYFSQWNLIDQFQKKSYNNSNFKDNRFLVILEDNFFPLKLQMDHAWSV